MSVSIQIAQRLEESERFSGIEAVCEYLASNLERAAGEMGYGDSEISVRLTDNGEIERLNRQWRDEARPTDVISFPSFDAGELPESPPLLGDIVISLEYARELVSRESHRKRVAEHFERDPGEIHWNLMREIHFLGLHGLLHLLGYTHDTPETSAEIEEAERRLWEVMEWPVH